MVEFDPNGMNMYTRFRWSVKSGTVRPNQEVSQSFAELNHRKRLLLNIRPSLARTLESATEERQRFMSLVICRHREILGGDFSYNCPPKTLTCIDVVAHHLIRATASACPINSRAGVMTSTGLMKE
ncbi:hypothetical protein H257_11645 [Aphanomyces astaci]|uniref:Uncharacterized protein n=1 Tax=Aphanomyces astaci TaxID=112090 RepID=W4G2M2_APHAT|nr:hypothetical protein H257_11645 [Aphanomyces astaci]ETV73521.1 hypothetical protein H257_11645 [Aphanomyces astaci]|eukprot:XP_009836947.1 hypothetical protein H257_11645 [Aphanomyces astaci]